MRQSRFAGMTEITEADVKVLRIVPIVKADRVDLARQFYGQILGLDVLMDFGWIATYGSTSTSGVQISFASEGGSGTETPDISVEVDDLDEAIRRVQEAGIPILYGPASEPWGVRRFYVMDPFGRLVNILTHT